jgi:hypothetical protein
MLLPGLNYDIARGIVQETGRYSAEFSAMESRARRQASGAPDAWRSYSPWRPRLRPARPAPFGSADRPDGVAAFGATVQAATDDTSEPIQPTSSPPSPMSRTTRVAVRRHRVTASLRQAPSRGLIVTTATRARFDSSTTVAKPTEPERRIVQRAAEDGCGSGRWVGSGRGCPGRLQTV